MNLTAQQLDALAKLIRLRSVTVVGAARRVLVDEVQSSVAADEAGISRQRLSDCLTRIRRAYLLAQVVAGCK